MEDDAGDFDYRLPY